MTLYEMKAALAQVSGVSLDAMHVIAGVCIQLLVARLLRVPLSRPSPWLAVLAIELINEYYDLHVETWPDQGVQLAEGAKDILLTMLLPTILMVLVRKAPRMFVHAREPATRLDDVTVQDA